MSLVIQLINELMRSAHLVIPSPRPLAERASYNSWSMSNKATFPTAQNRSLSASC